jgi:hypothetical protein
LDLGNLRIVHACWRSAEMRSLEHDLGPGQTLTDQLILAANREGTREFQAIEVLLKGPDIRLPDGYCYRDPDGQVRCRARLRWWDASADTLRSAAEIPSYAKSPDGSPFPKLPDTPLGESENAPYTGKVPVLYGHYWRSGACRVDTAVTACVDYSAGKGGPLVAYRWDEGDRELSSENFVSFTG